MPIDPGDPGFSEPGFIRRLFTWGTDFIYSTGQIGLQLFNALRRRWPGASRDDAGRWSRWLGKSAREGVRLTQLEGSGPVGVGEFPLIGGDIWAEQPAARWHIVAQVKGADSTTGETEYRTVNLFGTREPSADELAEMVLEQLEERGSLTDPRQTGRQFEPQSIKYLTAAARF